MEGSAQLKVINNTNGTIVLEVTGQNQESGPWVVNSGSSAKFEFPLRRSNLTLVVEQGKVEKELTGAEIRVPASDHKVEIAVCNGHPAHLTFSGRQCCLNVKMARPTHAQ